MNFKNKLIIGLLFFISGVLGFVVSWYQHKKREPDIQVIETFHTPVSFVSQLEGDPDAGKKIFKEFCASCHSKTPAISVNAPKINDKSVWGALNQLGVKKLLAITVQGRGAMPARGGCFECSDALLEEAIRYMLKASRAE